MTFFFFAWWHKATGGRSTVVGHVRDRPHPLLSLQDAPPKLWVRAGNGIIVFLAFFFLLGGKGSLFLCARESDWIRARSRQIIVRVCVCQWVESAVKEGRLWLAHTFNQQNEDTRDALPLGASMVRFVNYHSRVFGLTHRRGARWARGKGLYKGVSCSSFLASSHPSPSAYNVVII